MLSGSLGLCPTTGANADKKKITGTTAGVVVGALVVYFLMKNGTIR